MTHPLTNALAMRTAAATVAHDKNACCPDCAEQAASAILALPLEADHAALLAEARKLPKIARLMATLEDVICGRGMFGIDPAADLKWALDEIDAALSALETP